MEEIRNCESIDQWLSTELKRIYDNEIAVKQNLSEWIKKSSHPKLKILMLHYFELMKHHVNSLEIEIEKAHLYASSQKYIGIMESMIKEINHNIDACIDHNLVDVSIISGLQLINHYKISRYGTIATIADMLGKNKLSFMIRGLEENEKTTDVELTKMAVHGINQAAIIEIGR